MIIYEESWFNLQAPRGRLGFGAAVPVREPFLCIAGRPHALRGRGRGCARRVSARQPELSFEFRGLVADLRDRFRCVAPDHLGFGLSARPGRGEEHHPAAHAENFIALMHHLGLDDVTLFLADWGGRSGWSLRAAIRSGWRVW